MRYWFDEARQRLTQTVEAEQTGRREAALDTEALFVSYTPPEREGRSLQ